MHKKLLLWVVLMGMFMLFLSLSVNAVQEPAAPETAKVEKCVMPAGTTFVILHKRMGPVPVFSPKDATITILKVRVSKDGTEVAEFSLSYDKPGIACQVHGIDPYDTYKHALGMDTALVRKDFLKCEE